MKKSGFMEGLIFRFSVIMAFISVVSLVIVFILWDQSMKKLTVEYEIFRLSTALFEESRNQDGTNIDVDSLIGFGIYDNEGKPVLLRGSAPESPGSTFSGYGSFQTRYTDKTVILLRKFGMAGISGMRIMPGHHMPGESGMHNFRTINPNQIFSQSGELLEQASESEKQNQISQENNLQNIGTGNLMIQNGGLGYVEMDISNYFQQKGIIYTGAVFFIILTAGIVLLLLVLWNRYRKLRINEEKNRELASLGEAARTISHEIKNPLSVISVHCGILKNSIPVSHKESVKIIEEETLRISGLINKIRDFLKSDVGEPVRVDMKNFLEKLVERWGNKVELSGTADCIVSIDPERLESSVDNIIRNAIEAQESIQIHSPVIIKVMVVKNHFRLSVMDRGPGISDDQRSFLFKPFYTTKRNGTGLGLALSAKNISRANGILDYSLDRQNGSVFTIQLPVKALN